MDHPLRIAFCITCMNRLHQLRQTLPVNLAQAAALPYVEFCLLNYNSQDGLDAWVREHLQEEMASGRVRYGHETTATTFHGPRAKNLAHRLATADVVFTLDADNFLGNAVPVVQQFFGKTNRIAIHNWSGTWHDGTCGRVALTRDWFDRLGGYDEGLLGYGYLDFDLLRRARALGLSVIHFPSPPGTALQNTKEDTARYTGLTLSRQDVERTNQARSAANLRAGQFQANPHGWGRGTLRINFQDMVTW